VFDFLTCTFIAIRKSRLESQGNTFDRCGQIMAYADDVVGDYKILKMYLRH